MNFNERKIMAMARKYNNLTLLYRVNIQRKNSVTRKRWTRHDQPMEATQATAMTAPATTPPVQVATAN